MFHFVNDGLYNFQKAFISSFRLVPCHVDVSPILSRCCSQEFPISISLSAVHYSLFQCGNYYKIMSKTFGVSMDHLKNKRDTLCLFGEYVASNPLLK